MADNPVLNLGIIFIVGFLPAWLLKKFGIFSFTVYVCLGIPFSPLAFNFLSKEIITMVKAGDIKE